MQQLTAAERDRMLRAFERIIPEKTFVDDKPSREGKVKFD